MRTSGEGRQRLITILSVMALLLGGTTLAGRLAPKRPLSFNTVDPSDSSSPLSAERREKLRQLQKIVSRLRHEAREGNWSRVVELTERDAHRSGLLRALQAEAMARQGQHDEVVATLKHLYKNHADPSFYLLTGRRADYEKLIVKDLDTVSKNPDLAGTNIHAAWIASLDPLPRPEAERFLHFAERGVALSEMPRILTSTLTLSNPLPRRNTGQPDRADALRVLGIVLYRQGRYTEALESLKKAEEMRSTPHIWPFLSLSYRKLGRHAEAEEWDQTLRRYMSHTFGAQARPSEFYLYLRELDAAKPV